MSGFSYRSMVDALVRQGVPSDKAERAAAVYAEVAPAPKRRHQAAQKAFDFAAVRFKLLCKVSGLPMPVTEHYFAKELPKPRHWRFDFAWPEEMVALEVEGGIHTNGRHVRGKGYEEDMVKYSTAATLGWKVLRVTPHALCTEGTIEMLRKVLP